MRPASRSASRSASDTSSSSESDVDIDDLLSLGTVEDADWELSRGGT